MSGASMPPGSGSERPASPPWAPLFGEATRKPGAAQDMAPQGRSHATHAQMTPAQAAHVFSVSQLAAVIDQAIRDGVPPTVRVLGEITGFSRRTHWYFSLKDAGAVVSCVLFSSQARMVGFQPRDGDEVVVTGRLEFFAKQGRTQLYVQRIEPVGAGAMELELRRLVEELRGLGWLDPGRKRALPAMPRRVAVITSRHGAALQDVLDTMRRRCAMIPVLLADAPMQGYGAAATMTTLVRNLGRAAGRLGVDVILLTRGGGSKEDLAAFNDRGLAEAIVSCPVPVVAAIGHETDVTVAELVADCRCATPTQAAMAVTPDGAALDEQLGHAGERLARATSREIRRWRVRVEAAASSGVLVRHGGRLRQVERELGARAERLSVAAEREVSALRSRVGVLAARLHAQRPGVVLARFTDRLAAAAERLAAAVETRRAGMRVEDLANLARRAMVHQLASGRDRLEAAARSLELVGPGAVLRRGYSITQKEDGSIVRSTGDVEVGEIMRTLTGDGAITSRVEVVPGGAAPVKGPSESGDGKAPTAGPPLKFERSPSAVGGTRGPDPETRATEPSDRERGAPGHPGVRRGGRKRKDPPSDLLWPGEERG